MSASRDAILRRIRASTRAPAARVSSNPPLPEVGWDLPATFSQRARSLASDVVGPLARGAVPRAVADYLQGHQLDTTAIVWPECADLDWPSVQIATAVRRATGDDLVGITSAFCGIAETGTLMLLSGPATPATVSLLPETHVALLPAARIVARMEDAWALLKSERTGMPRAVNFVSGPSRTADIEQTVTLGAHGPYRVLIVLTD